LLSQAGQSRFVSVKLYVSGHHPSKSRLMRQDGLDVGQPDTRP
jgi:hypothetical protein